MVDLHPGGPAAGLRDASVGGSGSGSGGAGTDDVRLPSLGPLGWARWAWRQLTSMRTALLLLLLLAVAAVPGSVFPQRRIDPGRVQEYLLEHATTGPWLDRLGFFDVYTSPWFSAIYLLLFVSLVGCVLPRTKAHLAALRAAPPRTPRRLERMPAYGTHVMDSELDAVLAAARKVLRARRYRVADHPGDGSSGDGAGASLAAEKGYLAETGNLVFHLSLLGILAGVAAGSFLSWSGQILVVEKGTFGNSRLQYDALSTGRSVDPDDLPPLSFTLDSLKVQFESQAQGAQLGAPRQFDATLTVRDTPTSAPRTVVVRPNQPLDSGGVRAFIVGNGYAPLITVRDGNGDVAYAGPVVALPQDGTYKSLVVVKASDAKPRQIGLQGLLLPTYDLDPQLGPRSLFPDAIDPRLVLTAYVSRPGEDDLGVNSGVPQSVYRIDVSRMTQLTQDDQPLRFVLAEGETYRLPDGTGTVTFEGLRRFAAFDVRYDPTKGWVLVFAVLALAGVTASLFVRRRRVWVRVTAQGPGRTVVAVAGLARGEDAGLAHEVDSVLRAVTGRPAAAAAATPERPAGTEG